MKLKEEGEVKEVRILILPEEKLQSQGAFDLLNSFDGINAKTATSLKVAIDLIKTGDWDAVISGLLLEGNENGMDFLHQLRRFDQIFPFFFYTSENAPSVISAAFQAGANDYFIADCSAGQWEMVIEAVKVSAEIASLLRDKIENHKRSIFEEKYEMLFDELKEGSLMVSVETGNITYTNETFAESIGYSTEMIVGSSLESLLSVRKGAVSGWQELLQKALDAGTTVVQMSFLHKIGTIKSFWSHVQYLDLGNKPILLCRCRDVTRLELLEQEIYSVRNQLKVIVENSADAIVMIRDDGRIDFFGGSAPRMFGVSSDDMSIATVDHMFGHQASTIKKVISQMGNRPRISGIESQIVSRWGTQIPVSVAITTLPSSDNVVRYLLNIMDITPQKVIEAEKLMITELVGIMGTGAGPLEALPKLIARVSGKVPIEFGMVVGIDETKHNLKVSAIYSKLEGGKIRIGQDLDLDYLPAEEELWLREGIVRNNLQEQGLHPLESLLFNEGVRSYLSLSLVEKGKLIGGAHFGSAKAYALNRGHLSLFSQIASALTSTMLRAQKRDFASPHQLFASELAEKNGTPLLLCNADGRIFIANTAFRELFSNLAELTGRLAPTVLRMRFKEIAAQPEHLFAFSDKPLKVSDTDGAAWLIEVEILGERANPQGFILNLVKQ